MMCIAFRMERRSSAAVPIDQRGGISAAAAHPAAWHGALAYPGADHSRYSHSLGVMETARKMLDQLGQSHCSRRR